MFTGIVEEIGVIKGIKKGEESSKLFIKANKVLNQLNIGDSIATNGVCLTVTDLNNDSFEADVMAETLRRSNLESFNIGSEVNLERALSLEKRLGGHIVSGHIDGIGTLTSFIKEDNAIWITVKASMNILKYIVHKGSITIDGISLTVAYVDDSCFKVSIIPHTAIETTLLNKKVGNTVNLECDLIGKYVEKLLGLNIDKNNNHENLISEEFLSKNGFL
ncbi:riboflavin synthase [Paraclostridium sordellii]|uniref:riboflavin synthase n=1 Tax=Paraclostridium sordellii TaxID=1505 RepID=UPI000385D86A|nr:riboflavin synthase [Paeniclostridium sordellii]EPZ56933.1 riboflavin synthase, alpha subunit [[Clostridium] sordellii VPI 9048] [Paeniclostridium sordellii VPI 9048]CEK38651.1 Riboflavin synthase alpha subunit [[Clostridium] sordellii] [Paeniclostridium sordellii]